MRTPEYDYLFQNWMKMRSTVLLLVVVVLGVSAVQSQEFDKSLLRRLYNELAKRDDSSSSEDVRTLLHYIRDL